VQYVVHFIIPVFFSDFKGIIFWQQ